MRSLERDLLRWIVGTLVLGTLIVTLVAYSVTRDEMQEVFDGELRTIAEGVARMHHANRDWGASADLPDRHDEPDDVEILTQSWTTDGQRLYTSDPRVALPFSTTPGHSEPIVNGERWIVHTVVRHGFVAQAAQRRSQRQQMAGESAAKISSVLVGLVAGVGILLVYSLRRGLAPLDTAAREIAARTANSLEPIRLEAVPRELSPVLDSTNALLKRLAAAFTAQRRFLADAAHELRTPITALRLQLQLLQRSPDEASRVGALGELGAGIDRSQHLVEQLLQVSRSEPDVESMRLEPIDLGALARSVVGNFAARADACGVDLGVNAAANVIVTGDLQQLTVLLNNLVDNALRYAPGTEVNVEALAEAGRPILRVVDRGPGIPPKERQRVFDRFFRGAAGSNDPAGSGLGLAIVESITKQHGARIQLDDDPRHTGLRVSVIFRPASDSCASE